MAELSVLLPFHNAQATLGATLESIRQQTQPACELLLIDDRSTDTSREIVRKADLPGTRLLESPGEGLVDALNFGLEIASAPWIVRMDADDLMHPQRLSRQRAYLRAHPDTTVLGSRVELFPEGDHNRGYAAYVEWQNRCCEEREICDRIYIESPFAHPSVVVPRERVRIAGGYREGEHPED